MRPPKLKIDEKKLTPEQRDRLDNYHNTQIQLRTLQDLASMVQEVVGLLDDLTKDDSTQIGRAHV